MSLLVEGLEGLMLDCNNLAKMAGNSGVLNKALNAGADIVYDAAINNASGGTIQVRTGTILGAIRKRRAKDTDRGKRIDIGISAKQSKAFYANPVEFGHAGPHPAIAHPFIRPAYDNNVDEAYEAIKDELTRALDNI